MALVPHFPTVCRSLNLHRIDAICAILLPRSLNISLPYEGCADQVSDRSMSLKRVRNLQLLAYFPVLDRPATLVYLVE